MIKIASDLLAPLGIKSDHRDYCSLVTKELFLTSKPWDSFKDRDEKIKYCPGTMIDAVHHAPLPNCIRFTARPRSVLSRVDTARAAQSIRRRTALALGRVDRFPSNSVRLYEHPQRGDNP
jgi:hypothetical protein